MPDESGFRFQMPDEAARNHGLYPTHPTAETNIPGKRYVSGLSGEAIKALAAADGFVGIGPDTGSYQCAALVKAAIPHLGPASQWWKGADITGPDDENLKPGTAIGYGFTEEGRYRNKHGSHVAIVVAPTEREKEKGWKAVIIDQWDSGQGLKWKAEMHELKEKDILKYSLVTRK